MAIIKACLIGNSLKNTGKECDASMVATAMLIAVPPTIEITDDDLADPIAWITPLLHASKQNRVYPFFGNKAPINTINNNAESDILVTLDDGTQVFLRYGIYNRLYETIAGGICYAKALQGLNKSGFDIIEIDQQGQMLLHKNENGTFKGLSTTFMYSPSPIMADFKNTPYKNRFQYSFSPVEFVQNGEVFTGAGALLALMGLIDAEITEAAASSVTTPAVSATRTVTVTAVGADGDTINVKQGTLSLSGLVTKTAAETTVTLLADKVRIAINANTATTGYTAINAAGVITITAPLAAGATLNGVNTAPTVTGTLTAGSTAFGAGVTSVAVLRIGVQTECAESDLLADASINAELTDLTNFIFTDTADDSVITPTLIALTGGVLVVTGPFLSGHTYNVIGAEPSVWFGNDIEGYDASENGVDILVP